MLAFYPSRFLSKADQKVDLSAECIFFAVIFILFFHKLLDLPCVFLLCFVIVLNVEVVPNCLSVHILFLTTWCMPHCSCPAWPSSSLWTMSPFLSLLSLLLSFSSLAGQGVIRGEGDRNITAGAAPTLLDCLLFFVLFWFLLRPLFRGTEFV